MSNFSCDNVLTNYCLVDKILAMHNGYILLWRKSLDSMVWKDRKLWRLWSWILMSARWKPGRDLLGRKPVDVGPGELYATTEGMAQATGLTVKEVRSALALGARVGVLRAEGTAWGTRITIVNWQEYQGQDAASGKKNAPAKGGPRGQRQPAPHKQPDKNQGEPAGAPGGEPSGTRGASAGQTQGQPSPYTNQETREGTQPATNPPPAHQERAAGAGSACAFSGLSGQARRDCQRFLDAYPKKAAQNAARALWAELAAMPPCDASGATPDDRPDDRPGLPPLDTLLEALARHCASPAWAAEGGRFIPTPANWLARRSWLGLATGTAAGLAPGSATGLSTGPGHPGGAIDQWLQNAPGHDASDNRAPGNNDGDQP